MILTFRKFLGGEINGVHNVYAYRKMKLHLKKEGKKWRTGTFVHHVQILDALFASYSYTYGPNMLGTREYRYCTSTVFCMGGYKR